MIPHDAIHVKLHTPTAIVPTRSTSESIGLEIHHSCDDTIIEPYEMATLDTDISIAPPKGTYVPIAPHSGLAHQHKLHALAGVIDADYRSAIKVMLQNMGTDPVTITQGQRIAQLVCKQAQLPSVLVTDQLEATK